MISDLDIWRSAVAMVKRYGDDAMLEAAARADQLMDEGDMAGCTTWQRILDAIERLQAKAPAGTLASIAELLPGHWRRLDADECRTSLEKRAKPAHQAQSLHDAAEFIAARFGPITKNAPLEHAVTLLMKAARSGRAGDRMRATEQVEVLLRFAALL